MKDFMIRPKQAGGCQALLPGTFYTDMNRVASAENPSQAYDEYHKIRNLFIKTAQMPSNKGK